MFKKETAMNAIVSITQFEIKPDKLNELKSRFEPLLKEAQGKSGFRKGILLTSQQGKCLAIGFWNSFEEAKKWGDTEFYKKFVSSLGELATGKSERNIYTLSGGDLSEIFNAQKAA